MGRHFRRKHPHVPFENHQHHLGCMWGLLHILNYHHWHNVKKMLPHRRHGGGKHAAGPDSPENNTHALSASDIQEYIDAETDRCIEKARISSLTDNTLEKPQIKALIGEEISKEDSKHHKSSTFPLQSQNIRVDSTHYFDPSNQTPPDLSPNKEILHKIDSLSALGSKKCELCGTESELEEFLSMKREFVSRILQDPDSPLAHHFHNRRFFSTKSGLTKSGSFPVIGSSGRKGIGPSRLSNKADNNSAKSTPLTSPVSPYRMGTKHFRTLKQKLKHAIKESRKESQRIMMDSILHKIPYGRKFLKDSDGNRDSPLSGYDSDLSVSSPINIKNGFKSIKRSSSLNESMDRYCQLYESSSFSREAKRHISDRLLKLKTEEVDSPSGSGSNCLGRILSLPDLKYHLYNQMEDPGDDLSSGTPDRNSGFYSENQTQADAIVGRGIREDITNDSSFKDQVQLVSVSNDEATAQLAEENEFMRSLDPELVKPSPISVLDSKFDEVISSPAGSKFKPGQLLLDEPDSYHKLHSSTEKKDGFTKVKTPRNFLDTDLLHPHVYEYDQAEFKYVRDILEISGLSGNDFLKAWHSADQPVDPSIFEEFSDNEVGNVSNHMLLFDLINQVLVEIYERSFIYCPILLSSCSHIRPMPMGYHVLDEVWANISSYLGLRPNLDQPFDHIMTSDLSKDGGWMNLQSDIEGMGLELEDLIFDDLLEEVLGV